MREKPVIGITVAHCAEELVTFPRALYVGSIRKAGGQPVLLPPVESLEEAREVLTFVDALLLTGGGDISPLLLGEHPRQGIGEGRPERDYGETLLAQLALIENLPLLGICRGLQVLAIAAGGRIYQDIVSECPEAFEHKQKVPREFPWHEVYLAKSRLEELLGQKTLEVNSLHHQAVSVLPERFIANALAPDGIIEGIEKPGSAFCMGVQWHPEAMSKESHSRKLFQGFVDAAGRAKAH